MSVTKSKQTTTGKSFEYALLFQFEEKLKCKTNLEVIRNSAFDIAKECFDSVSASERSEYLLAASFAVNLLMDIEPRLSNDIGEKDVLQLEILSDDHGKDGDVRDVLAIRKLQGWEIGVSAKNNHDAVKHSRLSADIDFGDKWLGMKSSKEYFGAVVPIFNELKKMREESDAKKKWSELGDYHASVYIPILKAFIEEMERMQKENPSKVASHLVSYLVGRKDFYKVIKRKSCIEVHAYNLNGTLNLPFKDVESTYRVPIVPLPTKIERIELKKDSSTTAVIVLNNEWTLSFRIHNASSRIEPSLKFDVTLLKSPKGLFRNTLNIRHE